MVILQEYTIAVRKIKMFSDGFSCLSQIAYCLNLDFPDCAIIMGMLYCVTCCSSGSEQPAAAVRGGINEYIR